MPLTWPSTSCWAKKYFCERLTISITSASETGMMSRATSVMSGLMKSIMATTPTTVVTPVMSCTTLCESVWPTVSTSLVMRESVSPVAVRSKYPKGMRSILRLISLRSEKHSFWTTPVISQLCTKVQAALSR